MLLCKLFFFSQVHVVSVFIECAVTADTDTYIPLQYTGQKYKLPYYHFIRLLRVRPINIIMCNRKYQWRTVTEPLNSGHLIQPHRYSSGKTAR